MNHRHVRSPGTQPTPENGCPILDGSGSCGTQREDATQFLSARGRRPGTDVKRQGNKILKGGRM